jgi:hypothetical protein
MPVISQWNPHTCPAERSGAGSEDACSSTPKIVAQPYRLAVCVAATVI